MKTIRYEYGYSFPLDYGADFSLQLNLQMVAGLAFPYYSEAKILFEPTYKYDIGTDRYDTSLVTPFRSLHICPP